ncbi:signal peptidase I [Candidatus Bathyarchaeota archaeon]|jgi:signal peptidase I|nr:signal peptidase I [Candidatus Bathyarchaeota archaeon]
MKRKHLIVVAVVVVFLIIAVWGYFGSIPYISPLIHGQKFLRVVGPSMQPTIRVGATVSYEEASFLELKVDDIIVFKRPGDNALIIARITHILAEGLEVKGDNNPSPYPYNITATEYVGKVVRIDNPP